MLGITEYDLLRLEEEGNIKDDGIHNQRHKTKASTGKRTVYEWSTELSTAVNLAREAKPATSNWQRFMARVIEETKVTEHFTEHDLRAKVASDATTLEHARSLLAHADSRTTDKIYRRKAERIKPLR